MERRDDATGLVAAINVPPSPFAQLEASVVHCCPLFYYYD
jgi:hypothetical protein